MRLFLLNALFLDPGVSGGPETYLRGLAPALKEAAPNDRVMIVTTRRGEEALRRDGWEENGMELASLPCDEGQRLRRQWCEQFLLPRVAKAEGASIVHSLANVAPIRMAGIPHVVTVHDANFMQPATFGAITRWGMTQVVPRAARNADRLIAVSETATLEMSLAFGVPADRFTVIHNGVEVAEASGPLPQELEDRLPSDSNRRLILCVGTIRPHKNQQLLVRALPSLPADTVLVLAGHPEVGSGALLSLADSLGVSDRLVVAGRVEDAALGELWARASVAAIPTLAEGFGFPVVEALARGVPVACSDLPVLREVGGSHPLYFDPNDPSAATAAIRELLDCKWDAGSARAWVERFSWDGAAAKTLRVYEDAVAGFPSPITAPRR